MIASFHHVEQTALAGPAYVMTQSVRMNGAKPEITVEQGISSHAQSPVVLDPTQKAESSSNRYSIQALQGKWTAKDDARFSELAAEFALGQISSAGAREFVALKMKRQQKAANLTPKEIAHLLKKRAVEDNLLKAFQQYVSFIESSDRQKA